MSIITTLSTLAIGAVDCLRCENQDNPLGIESVTPRLSWQINSVERGRRQTAYRVLVSSTPELLAKGNADLWDSGKVGSDRSHLVAYAGKPLSSHQRCFWKVGVWLKSISQVHWSPVSTWTMGFLSPEEWRADWIAMPGKRAMSKGMDLPIFRKSFVAESTGQRIRTRPLRTFFE